MRQSQTAYLILGMLSVESRKSGYDIRKAVESSVAYFWRESYGQIYPALKRLAAEGLIVPRKSASKGRPERQEYSLAPKGRACLRTWLAAPYRDDPPRNEFLLKLFFGRSGPAGVAAEHVRRSLEDNKRLLAALLEIEKQARVHNAGNPHLPFWLLTLKYGIAQTRASVEWGKSALTMLLKLKGESRND